MGKIKTEKRASRKGLSEELTENPNEVRTKQRRPKERKRRRKDDDESVGVVYLRYGGNEFNKNKNIVCYQKNPKNYP